MPSFDAVVANPPFSYRWEPTEALGEDQEQKTHQRDLFEIILFR